jgi:hypothetical protein
MSPVHVIVGEDQRAEAMWANAFTGAVDLYRFPRNVDAFERLTAAEAPIDLVVLTPAQHGPFNLTPDQFIARVLESPLGASRFLANLHVIVVGQQVERSHPRVMAVSTLEAAIRLVKFGEIEQAPRAAVTMPTVQRPNGVSDTGRHPVDSILADMPFSGTVISSIWDAPDPEPTPDRRPPVTGGGGRAAAPVQAPAVTSVIETEPLVPQLFTRVAPAGFVVASGAAPTAGHAAPVVGGGPAQVGAPHESIEVATGALQPSRPYVVPSGGAYRGPGVRMGQVHGAAHATGQPVPPALGSQIQSLVYGQGAAQIADPLLTWSSSSRGQVVAQGVPVPVPVGPPAAPVQVPSAHTAPVTVAVSAPRTVPLDPPAGVYGAPAHAVAAPAPAVAADTFRSRAEPGGGGVSFG